MHHALYAVNPCLTCGACCAFYRASFYWAEADDGEGGAVPAHLTTKLSPFLRMMKGTGGSHPHCIALQGTIGAHAACSIYHLRASVCREFAVSWQFGVPNERCDKARLAWGLQPLTPDSWNRPGTFRKVA